MANNKKAKKKATWVPTGLISLEAGHMAPPPVPPLRIPNQGKRADQPQRPSQPPKDKTAPSPAKPKAAPKAKSAAKKKPQQRAYSSKQLTVPYAMALKMLDQKITQEPRSRLELQRGRVSFPLASSNAKCMFMFHPQNSVISGIFYPASVTASTSTTVLNLSMSAAADQDVALAYPNMVTGTFPGGVQELLTVPSTFLANPTRCTGGVCTISITCGGSSYVRATVGRLTQMDCFGAPLVKNIYNSATTEASPYVSTYMCKPGTTTNIKLVAPLENHDRLEVFQPASGNISVDPSDPWGAYVVCFPEVAVGSTDVPPILMITTTHGVEMLLPLDLNHLATQHAALDSIVRRSLSNGFTDSHTGYMRITA